MSEIERVLEVFEEAGRFSKGVVERRIIPSASARYREFPEGVSGRLVDVLNSLGIEKLYSHQTEAVDSILSGRNTVIVTPTATGKTLCYAIPIVQKILDDPKSRALLLFPTKALARDQVAGMEQLAVALGERINVFPFDGDTPQGKRGTIRQTGHVVVTNPDMLHTGILPHHTKWAKFLQNLEYVVVDEIHNYRGIFGSHVANVVRRLKRICAFYGKSPVFVCCSATIANPKEMAEAMIEEEFSLISENGAPRGVRHFIFYNPPLIDPERGIRRSVVKETGRIAARFIHEGIQTIVFGPSRLRVEILAKYLKRVVKRLKGSEESVAGYRGGYLPSERRDVERGIKSGRIVGVVGTTALELGVDIGTLGASIMSGYPGTIASTWQQAGRAGRRNETSAAVLIASAGPLDQYLINHPEYFFETSPERGIVYPDNLYILVNHLKCAAFELPFEDGERFGNAVVDGVLKCLEETGILRHTGGRWFWSSSGYPAAEVSLRSATSDNFLVVDAGRNNEVLADVDGAMAPSTIHEGAVYIHQSRTFRVETLDWAGKTAYVREVDSDYYTTARDKTDIDILEVVDETILSEPEPEVRFDDGSDVEPSSYCFGRLCAISRVETFQKIRFETHEDLGTGEVRLPEQELETEGYWIGFGMPLCRSLHEMGMDVPAGLRGLAFVLRNTAPLFVMCDPRDIRVTVMIPSPSTGRPTVFLYDRYPGGIGISRGIYRLHKEIIGAAYELVDECRCAYGCPSCVGPSPDAKDAGKGTTKVLLKILAK